MSTRGFAEENDAARKELSELLTGLDERSLGYPVGTGWTVATSLCHLAFWDQRALYLLREWAKGVRIEVAMPNAQTVESLNQAVNAIATTVPGPAAVRLCLESAAAIDSFLAGIGDDVADRIAAAGFERYLRRALHRREHIAKIREVLG